VLDVVGPRWQPPPVPPLGLRLGMEGPLLPSRADAFYKEQETDGPTGWALPVRAGAGSREEEACVGLEAG
jgi:hypothetical protein